MQNLNKLSKEIYQNNVNVGWWDANQCLITKCKLIVSESCEAMEGIRKNLKDDHLPERPMFEVELADTLIRTLDLGGKLNLFFNVAKQSPHGEIREGATESFCLFWLDADTIHLGQAIFFERDHEFINKKYQNLISNILKINEIFKLDVIGAMLEKIEYNKHRADHKKENREGEKGKTF